MRLINKNRLTYCLIVTAICFFIVHGFAMTNNFVSHDSLNEFDATIFGNDWKIQLGRVFVPFYRMIFRTSYTPVWLIGVISILFLGLTLYLISDLFKIKSKLIIFLISGIMTSNLTIISQISTYINDLDQNMCALFLAALAVYLWKNYNRGFLFGSIAIMFSVGLYQSFISVAIVLVIMLSLIELLQNIDSKLVFINGLKAILMLILGCLMYYICLKIIPSLCNIELIENSYNSVINSLNLNIKDILINSFWAIYLVLWNIFTSMKSYDLFVTIVINGLILSILAYLVFNFILDKSKNLFSKILFVSLIGITPLCMNIAHVLTNGMSHMLMYYSIWFVYVFVLICIFQKFKFRKRDNFIKYTTILLVIIILWNNLLTANVVYMKKDIEKQSSMLLFNRIISDLEDVSDYTFNESKVVFIGKVTPLLQSSIDYSNYISITGNYYNNVLGVASRDYFKSYFDYIFNYPIHLVDSKEWSEYQKNEIVKQMPSYPEAGYIQQVDDVIVIKLSMGE